MFGVIIVDGDLYKVFSVFFFNKCEQHNTGFNNEKCVDEIDRYLN